MWRKIFCMSWQKFRRARSLRFHFSKKNTWLEFWTDYLGRNSSLDLQYHPEVNPQKWRSIATAADKSLILSLTLNLRLTLSLTLKHNLEHNIVVITHFSVAVAILYYFWQLASKRYLQLASAVNAMHPCSCRAHWWVTTEIPMYSRHSTCTSALIELIE